MHTTDIINFGSTSTGKKKTDRKKLGVDNSNRDGRGKAKKGKCKC